MEGDTPHWTHWFNFDAGSDAQPHGFKENQGDLGAEKSGKPLLQGSSGAGTPDLGFEPLSLDQSWPLNDSIVPTHPFIRCLSPSMFNFRDLNSQQHVQRTSLSESAIYAEPMPQPYLDHDPFIKGAVLEDIAGIEQPQVDSCLTRPDSEEENCDQRYPDPNQECSCINCLLSIQEGSGYTLKCRSLGCQEEASRWDLPRHERVHFGKAGDYHCLEEGCKTITRKFADLRRHYTVRHCTNATKFPCPVLGCKYGGDNGFTRKDKLKSHHRNVHQGKVVLGKASQLIKPKANGAIVIEGKPQVVQTIKPKAGAGA